MDRVHPSIMETLLRQPETGMGWQLVDVTTDRGEKAVVPVLNAEYLVDDRRINADGSVDAAPS